MALLDGDGTAYGMDGVDGIVLDGPAATGAQLVGWSLRESRLGAARPNRAGKDAAPLVARAPGASRRPRAAPFPASRPGEDHPVVKQIARRIGS
ncbi:hypothetical protein [Streptomyces sp. NPDC005533]|uniref:hypothetical protein n=1 Tax=Streptomyces sp. NPDC005533 TaxID=3364723 RepID=UPI00369CBA3A